MEPQKPKILIFSTAYLPFIGGAEVAIKEITDRISDFGFDLITARFKRSLPKVEIIGNVKVYRVGFGLGSFDKFLLPLLGAFKTLSLKRKNNYKVFWCMMVTFGSLAAYKVNKISRKKIPIVLTLQEGDSEEHLTKRWLGMIDWSWRMALKKSKYVTAISSYLLDRARRFGYKGEAKLVPNGVDVERFKNQDSRIKTENEVVLITTSRLVTKNAVGDIIESLKYLPNNIRLKIAGVGQLEQKLKQKTKSLLLESRIDFCGDVPNSEVHKYLHKSDIFIRPSLSEGFGISFIEAMAAGLPVIATPVGGIPDFLKDEETGLFCEVNNPQSIANAVLRLINDSRLAEKIKGRAFDMVKEKYDWNIIAIEMNKVFHII